jgi:hypothetical protein
VTPTLVPVLRTIEAGDLRIGLVAIGSYDGECCLRGTVGAGHETAFALRSRVTDDAGRTYEGRHRSSRGTATWAHWEQQFPEPFDTSAGTIVVDLAIGNATASVSIELPSPNAPSHAELQRCEVAESPRWPPHLGTPNVDEWRPDDANAARAASSAPTGRVLPDDVVALSATAHDVAGGDLTFLGVERWDDVCALHAFWDGPDTTHYSPVYAHYLQLDTGERTTTAVVGGGGHVGNGFGTTHWFFAAKIPERFMLRRPAIDGGPPLVEVGVTRST